LSPTTTHLFFLLRSFNFYTFSNPILPTFFNPVLPLQQIQNSHFSSFPLLQYPWFINSKRNQGFLIVVTYYDSLFFLLRSFSFYTFFNTILPTFFNPILPLQHIPKFIFSRFPLFQYPWFIKSKRNQGVRFFVTYYDSLFFLLRSYNFYNFSNPILPTFFNPILPLQQIQKFNVFSFSCIPIPLVD
jgi:hypothetical protein